MAIADVAEFREILSEVISEVENVHLPAYMIADLKRLRTEAKKNAFSLKFAERILLFCALQAFVTGVISFSAPVESIGWFPDRDDMTTFAGGTWKTLATLAYQVHWKRRMNNKIRPTLGIIDHRADLSTVYDPLVRVADFLAATSARWQLDTNRLSRPPGAKDDAGTRYRRVLRGWFAENELLWLGRLYLPDGSVRATRVVLNRSRQ